MRRKEKDLIFFFSFFFVFYLINHPCLFLGITQSSSTDFPAVFLTRLQSEVNLLIMEGYQRKWKSISISSLYIYLSILAKNNRSEVFKKLQPKAWEKCKNEEIYLFNIQENTFTIAYISFSVFMCVCMCCACACVCVIVCVWEHARLCIYLCAHYTFIKST